ncbi:2-methylisocitrate lyase [Dickeya fangzhongdai]|uniref:isocitrate lyase/PEP mutase family protein n=1 Tax=Dickeya fangzhongdai TaxID=1778540 RepID=UPI0005733AA7|nr:isocitrate lyase/phosphoenolpyruvate mutase family protein [Dickeya fangzhongdai]KHN59546.1 2-methylisocitrate lyase [Dickeya fangzhongdai]
MAKMSSDFRKLHEAPGAFIIPNPWDVGTARILAAMGFKALATTSAGMSFSMGMREGNVNRATTLAHCRALVKATPLPVSADLENGFGDSPESVAETIRAAGDIGLAGGSIEDYSGRTEQPIYDFQLAVERIQAAAEARDKLAQDFVLTARCENYLWGKPDLDDTIKRLLAFEKAGADVLYAPGLQDLDSIRTVCSALSKPVNAIAGIPGATFSMAQLERAGVKRISVGSALSRLALGAFIRAAEAMGDAGDFSALEGAMGFSDIERYFPRGG